MSTFSETIQPVIAKHSNSDLRAVLALLGSEVGEELSQLDTVRRATLVDRLVRNLRGMSVAHGPNIERELLRATGAEPRGTFNWELSTATALVEVRSGLKYLATWFGYQWAEISRLQAVVCGLARWVQGSGQGTLSATVERQHARFMLRLTIPGFDTKTIETSALVVAVREVTDDFAIGHEADTVVLNFKLTQR